MTSNQKEASSVESYEQAIIMTKEIAINTLVALNLYQEDYKSSQIHKVRIDTALKVVANVTEANLSSISKYLGEGIPDIKRTLKMIISNIRDTHKIISTSDPSTLEKRNDYFKDLRTSAVGMLDQPELKRHCTLGEDDLDKFRDQLNEAVSWLKTADTESKDSEFINSALGHSGSLLVMYYNLRLSDKSTKDLDNDHIKNVADQLDRLSGEYKTPDMDVESVIHGAGKKRVTLTFDYTEKDGSNEGMREVEPYSYRDKSGTRLFSGFDVNKQGIRLFIVENIHNISMTENEFTPRWPIEV